MSAIASGIAMVSVARVALVIGATCVTGLTYAIVASLAGGVASLARAGHR